MSEPAGQRFRSRVTTVGRILIGDTRIESKAAWGAPRVGQAAETYGQRCGMKGGRRNHRALLALYGRRLGTMELYY